MSKKPSFSQLETLRELAAGKHCSGIAERFAALLTDAGLALLEAKSGHCSKCDCKKFVLDASSQRGRCVCKHYEYRHGR